MYAVVISGKIAEQFNSLHAAQTYQRKHGGIIRKLYHQE
jgi:hypothetical protein